MIIELIITLEILAFLFLALGIVPFKPNKDSGNLPLANKVLFIFVACILFFALGFLTVRYEYTYCYINETMTGNNYSSIVSDATCGQYAIESLDLSFINYGLGVISIVLGVMVIIIASLSKNDDLNNEP